MLINKTIPGVYGGISKQPIEFILDNQVTDMVNCIPTIEAGTFMRPRYGPIAYGLKGEGVLTGKGQTFTLYEDKLRDNVYLILVLETDSDTPKIMVTDIDSKYGATIKYRVGDTDFTSASEDGYSSDYLKDDNGEIGNSSFGFLTVQDTTFIYNKNKTVTQGTPNLGNVNYTRTGLYYVTRSDLAVPYTYTININGQLYSSTKANSYEVYAELKSLIAGDQETATMDRELVVTDTSDYLKFEQYRTTAIATGTAGIHTYFKVKLYNSSGPVEYIGLVDLGLPLMGGDYLQGILNNPDTNIYSLYCEVNRVVDFYTLEDIRNLGTSGSFHYRYYDEFGSFIGGNIVTYNVVREDLPSITVTDSYGNLASEFITGKVGRLDELPTVAPDGALIEVNGEEITSVTSIYLEFTDGVWKETKDPNYNTSFNLDTLPLKIFPQFDGGNIWFKVETVAFDEGKVGNDISSPVPTFVTGTIQDMFFYRNRLGILSKDSIILSEVANYFNFWTTTTTSIPNSDRIDVSVASTSALKLYYAIPFQEQLILFSESGQYVAYSNGTLTPESIIVAQSTAYKTNIECRPILVGDRIIFSAYAGVTNKIFEYIVDSNTVTKTAIDLGGHIEGLIEGKVIGLAGSSELNYIFVITDSKKPLTHTGDGLNIYLYKYFNQGDERVQSAWSRWILGRYNVEQCVEDCFTFFDEGDISVNGVILYNDKLLLSVIYERDGLSYSNITVFRQDGQILMSSPPTNFGDSNEDFFSIVDQTGTWIDGSHFEASITLPKWEPKPEQIVRTTRGALQIKDIDVRLANDNDSVTVDGKVLTKKDNRVYILSSNDKEIKIKNNGSNPFTLTSLNLRGTYRGKSKETL